MTIGGWHGPDLQTPTSPKCVLTRLKLVKVGQKSCQLLGTVRLKEKFEM
jgi:hypothetical protein